MSCCQALIRDDRKGVWHGKQSVSRRTSRRGSIQMKSVGREMMPRRLVTGAQAGLSGDDRIKIA